MSQVFSFQCSKCDVIHKGIPSFSFDAPALYYDIPESERESRVFLTSESCVIDDEYYFAKGLLELPVDSLTERLAFTPWVSLSESNFYQFQDSLSVENASEYGPMFGWFCTQIDEFPDCEGLKTKLSKDTCIVGASNMFFHFNLCTTWPFNNFQMGRRWSFPVGRLLYWEAP